MTNFSAGEDITPTLDTQAGRVAVLVLGMHRSGTSAMARVLSLLGCALPRTLLGANPSQEAGHWESATVCAFNDEILAATGSEWCDWLPIHDGWYHSPLYRDHVARGRAVLREEFGAGGLFVLKDPRICRIVPFWRDILAGEGIRPAIVMPVRNPLEVADSLKERDGMDPALGMLLWLRHVLDAESATRGLARVVCSYTALLDNWAGVVDRIGQGLGLAWSRNPVTVAGEVERFLNPGLRHNVHAAGAVMGNPLLSGWIRQTYDILMRWDAAGEAEGDYPALDRIRAAFDEAGPAFARPLLAGREDHHKARELARQMAENRHYLEGRIAELQYDLAQAGDKGALEQECAGLRADLERARAQEGEAVGELRSAQGDLARARAEAEAAQEALDTLQEWVVDLEARVQDGVAGDMVAAAQAEMGRLQAEAEAAGQRARAEAARADLSDARWSEAARELAAAACRMGEMESALIQRQEENAQVWAELAEAQRALDAMAEAAEAARAEATQLAEKLRESEEWVFRLAGERQAGEAALRRADNQLDRSDKARRAAERELAQARADAARAQAVPEPAPDDGIVRDMVVQLADLRRQLRAADASRAGDGARIEHLHGEVATLTRLLREAQGQAQGAQAAREELEQKLADRYAEIVALTTTLKGYETDARHGPAQAEWLREVSSVLIERSTPWAKMLAGWQDKRDLRLLKQRGLFDATAYLDRYPDVAASGIKPLNHFILHGLAEGRRGQA